MTLPLMGPNFVKDSSYLDTCWIRNCQERVASESRMGLCVEHLEWLREEEDFTDRAES